MRSLYKISLAILALGFLVVAGSAFAQDKPTFTITGDAGSAFGSFNYDKNTNATSAAANQKAFSEFVTSWESNVRMTWATDSFTSIVRYRIRGNNQGSGITTSDTSASAQSGSAFNSSSNDVYGETWWTPGAFKLGIGKYQGQAWSNPLSGGYVLNNPLGENEYWMNWTGISGLDAEYNVGVVQVGVAIASQCRPSCNKVPTNSTANSGDNAQSIVPHLTGAVGDISFRAQLPATSGTINNTTASPPLTGAGTTAMSTKSVSGSGFQAGVKWNGPGGLGVAADLGSFSEGKVTEIPAELKARQRDTTNLRVDIPAGPGSLMVQYFTGSDNNYGTKQYTTTTTTLRFSLPQSFGWIMPEYRTTTNGGVLAPASGTTAKDATNSEIRLILQGRF